jgi:Aerotolerance regulator N-terminal/von Willebrand factor type A domain
MPLSFLAPLFLGALAALAVPIVVHLIQRERKEAVQFPSLMFLSQVPYKSTRRRKIRNWALFLLRSAALAPVVAAFARPLLDRELDAASPLATARELVILVDRSYSMGYGDRWERALAAANRAIDGVSGEDRATLVLFDAGATAMNQATSDPVRLRAALDGAQPGSGVTRYGPAVKLAQSLLDASDKPRREVVIISDFQRAGWDGGEGVRLPAGTTVTPVAITDENIHDLAVAAVTLKREDVSGRERISVTARIANAGAEPVKGLSVVLALKDRDLETLKTDVAAGDVGTVSFSPFTLSEPNLMGTIRIQADALPADDAFNFVLSPGQAVNVLVADGGGQRASLYLERSLAINERPRFKPEIKRAETVRSSDLADRDVVIWNDATFPGGDTGRRLRTFIEQGGGLIAILGPRSNWSAAGDVLPGQLNQMVDREDQGAALGFIDYGHPVFEIFRAPRSGDLAAARFFRYRSIEAGPDAQVLARFDDGSPALLERPLGKGRVLVVTSTLDNFWNDLPVQPVFLPLVHRLAEYAAGWVEPSPWFTVGQVVDVAGHSASVAADSASADSAAAATPGRQRVAIAPSGGRLAVDNGLLRLEERGFYQVREIGQVANERIIAANVDLTESDLASMETQDLVSAIQPRGDATQVAGGADRIGPEDRERRQALWWYLLIVAFIALSAETVLSNRLSRRRAPAR